MGLVLTVTPNAALDLWTTTPELRSGAKLRCSEPRVDPGGGGINISRVLDRLGGETNALFAAGGCTGDRIADALDDAGVSSERVAIAADSREDVSLLEESTDRVYRLVMPGPKLRDHEEQALVDRTAELARQSAIIVGSGSLPPATRASFWAEISASAKSAGAAFILDSASATGPALDEGVSVLRANKEEAMALAGRDLDWPHEVADWASAQVQSGACETAVLTHGGEGAILVCADHRLLAAPPDVRAQSAIGAGDSFVAGLCLGLTQEKPHDEALRLAVATAAATLLTPGTELCRRQDVDWLVEECGRPETI